MATPSYCSRSWVNSSISRTASPGLQREFATRFLRMVLRIHHVSVRTIGVCCDQMALTTSADEQPPKPQMLPGEQEDEMLLETKNAVIYGGAIGGAVAGAFAREGARVFLVGRTRETVAADVMSAGGSAEVAVLDALDERAVEEHAQAVVAQAGSIDISFNLVTRGDIQGTPLVDMTVADLVRPITNGVTTNFLTARAAARHMIEQESGVILTLDSGSANGSPMMGGTGDR